jgi:hypothetical protein
MRLKVSVVHPEIGAQYADDSPHKDDHWQRNGNRDAQSEYARLQDLHLLEPDILE